MFENKLLLSESLVHNLKAIKHNEYVEKECEKIPSDSESSEVDSLDREDWFSEEENRYFENSNKNDDDIENNNIDPQNNDKEISENANSEFSSNEGKFLSNTKATELLKKKLSQWVNKHSISHAALNDLLHILSPQFNCLPRDARTVLGTPREVQLKSLSTGEYYHFGLSKVIEKYIRSNENVPEEMELDFNIDGIPLYKSSNTSFWPILGRIVHNYQKPFVIGIFCGSKKPTPQEFLSDLISDLNCAITNGLNILNKTVKIKIRAFICDAPARSYLKCIKPHTGYFSCERCIIEGQYYAGRMTFPYDKASAPTKKRSDASFAAQEDEEHHLNISPLTQVPDLGLVSDFVLDYMHLICLGVMRRLLLLWTSGKIPIKLPSKGVDELSKYAEEVSESIPVEFSRNPRSLREVKRWKATEFRLFLLYTGPVILKNYISTAMYQNFLLLHAAIFILTHDIRKVNLAEELLKMFVSHSIQLYGLEFSSYNVHNLLHITDDIRRFGPPDTISCFPFENFLGQLKHSIKSGAKPLQQVVKRIAERQNTDESCEITEKIEFKYPHFNGPLLDREAKCTQYHKLVTPSFTLKSNNLVDSCCLIDDSICIVQNFIEVNNTKYALYKKSNCKFNVYHYPIKSSSLNIFTVSDLTSNLKCTTIDKIKCKCLLIHFKTKFFSFPLHH